MTWWQILIWGLAALFWLALATTVVVGCALEQLLSKASKFVAVYLAFKRAQEKSQQPDLSNKLM